MTMPRRRKIAKHLPEGLYQHGKGYRMRVYDPVTGKPGWEPLGRDLAAALTKYAQIKHLPSQGTLGAAIKRYMDEVLPHLAQSTQRTEKPRLATLDRVFGHMAPDHVTQRDLYQYLDARPKVAGNREIARLGAVYKKAIRWGIATRNPCIGLERNREEARDRYVTDEEFATSLSVALWRAFAGERSAVMVYAVMRLEELTGRRESDLLRIRRSDLSTEGIYFKEGKTGKRVLVEWSDELSQAVEAIKGLCRPVDCTSMWLIPNRDGGKCSEQSFNQAWQRLRPWLSMMGVEPFQPRDVRAKHATDFDEQGGDATDQLGHSGSAVTRKHYLRKPRKVRPLR